MAHVIRADHEDHEFRGNAVQLTPFGDAPDHVFRAVRAVAEVDRVAVSVVLGPNFSAGAFPVVRDRIAEKNEIDRTLFLLGEFLLVTVCAPLFTHAGNGLDRDVGSVLREDRAGQNEQRKNGNEDFFHVGTPELKRGKKFKKEITKTFILNSKPISLQAFHLNTDFHGFKGLKGFHFLF